MKSSVPLFALLVPTLVVSCVAIMSNNVHSLRKMLLSGGKSYGPLILSDSPIVAEMLSGVGYGHIVVDHEHSPTDVRSGYAVLQAIKAGQRPGHPRTSPIVRLPSPNDPVYMKKVLDSLHLPGGVLVPMVDDADTAAAVVRSTRYPTQRDGEGGDVSIAGGIRGCASPFVRGSAWGLEPEYLERCTEDLLVMVQVETAEGVAAIPDIAAVPGVDAIFLGPFDLSASIGKMGRFRDPEVRALIRRAERAVVAYGDSAEGKKSPCLLAGFQPPERDLKAMFDDDGYSLVCGSVDLGLLREAARKDWEAAKRALADDGEQN